MIDEIISCYEQTLSIRETAKRVNCSWNRVVKILSSNGIIINDTHKMILDLYDKGKTLDEIAAQTGHSTKTVQAYLPATRPLYGINPSVNAQRAKRWRENKRCDL